MGKNWFPKNPKHSGWRKNQKPSTRRSHLMSSTKKSMTHHNRYLSAGRKAQALANVTTDPATEKKARSDASYFFMKAKKR